MKPRSDGSSDGTAEESSTRDLVELVLEDHARRVEAPPPERIDGVVVGRVVALAKDGSPIVEYDEWTAGPLVARSMVEPTPADVGRACALVFEGGKPQRPLVMGWMFEPAQAPDRAAAPSVDGAPSEPEAPAAPERVLERNGERLVFEAEREIVLKCGRASITLTRAGKILIRGAYLLARSSGVNRIQGGSVQIN